MKLKKISTLKKKMMKMMLKMKLNLWKKKKLMDRTIFLGNKRVSKKNISNLSRKKVKTKKEMQVAMLPS